MPILFALIVICIIAYIAFYIINNMGLPQPLRMLVGLVVGIILLAYLLHTTGVPTTF